MHSGDHPQGFRRGAIAWRQPGKQNLSATIGKTASPSSSRSTAHKTHATTVRPDALKREISLALIVKLALLVVIWLIFFRDPLARSLNTKDMDRVLLGPDANAPAATVHSLAYERGKESRHEP